MAVLSVSWDLALKWQRDCELCKVVLAAAEPCRIGRADIVQLSGGAPMIRANA